MEINKQSVNQSDHPQQQLIKLKQKQEKEVFELTDLEKVLDKANGQGKYQVLSFVIFAALWFFASWMLVGQSFFFQDEFTCKTIQNSKKCHQFICSLPSNRIKDQIKWHSNSIVFSFDEYMICQKQYVSTVLISIFYIGSLFGFFLIPSIADNYGRKIAMQISWAIYAIGVLFMAIAFHPALIGIGEFLAGFGCNPAITLCYSFLNQQCLRGSRQHYGVAIQIFIALGECIIGLLFLPDITWRYVFFMLFGLVILTFISLSYLLESPKFLLSRDKVKTLEVLNTIARRNGRQRIQIQEIEAIQTKNEEENSSSMLDLFRYKSLRSKTIAAGITFLGIQAIYYSTLLNLGNAGYDKLVNQQIIGVSQAISYVATQFFISKIRRKKGSIIGMGTASLFCFILAILQMSSNEGNENAIKLISTICLMVARFVLCSFWSIFYVYIAEMYPTRVRSLGFGWSSAMGTIGSSLSPYIILFSEDLGVNTWIPPGIIGCISVISLFFLTETYGKPLQDEIEETKTKI